MKIEYGHIKLKPIVYSIRQKTIVRFWFLNKTEYYVECDYSSIGPFDTLAEAQQMLFNLSAHDKAMIEKDFIELSKIIRG
jgi:hypothetical protein